jgi:hypothetical protein
MEPEKTQLDGKRVFRIGRLEIGVNLFVQVLVWVLIVVMLNYWSARHFRRFDWGRNTNLELTPVTKNVLANLQKPVRAIIYFSGENPEAEVMATSLLREYQYAAGDKFSIETLNPDADRARAVELSAKYKLQDRDSVIIFDYDGRSQVVPSGLLAEMDEESPQEKMIRMQQGGDGRPSRMVSFNGEAKMTGALMELIDPKVYKVYFLGGHGETRLGGPPNKMGTTLELLQEKLAEQRVVSVPLLLAEVDRIPEDASAVLVLGPNADFGDRDLALLTDYWNRKGRLLFCVGANGAPKPRLNAWLAERGVTPRGDDVLRTEQTLAAGGVVTVNLIRASGLGGDSPITKGGLQNHAYRWDVPMQSLAIDKTKEQTAQLRIIPFMAAPVGFWGETTPYAGTGTAPVNDKDRDNQMPLFIGVQVEKGGSEDPKLKIDAARMIVIGISETCVDRVAEQLPGVLDFAAGCMNWSLSREALIGISPKPHETVAYSVEPAQLAVVGYWIIFYIPLAIAIFGLYHLRWRHGKSFFLLTAWLAGIFLAMVAGWYFLLYAFGTEASGSTIPSGLIFALVGSALCGAGAIALHLVDRNKRPPTRP